MRVTEESINQLSEIIGHSGEFNFNRKQGSWGRFEKICTSITGCGWKMGMCKSSSGKDNAINLNQAGVNFYFAPPLVSRWLSRNGRPTKIRVGAWARYPLKILAVLKFLRGTVFDPFAYTAERQAEQTDLSKYLADIELIIEMVTSETMDSAMQLANAPSLLKGYGHVRTQHRSTWLEQRNRGRAELQLVQPLHLSDVNHRGTHE